MPPPKKGAKSLEEDFTDVPTLPQLNSLIFTLITDFKDRERKAQVSAKIKDEWKNKVRTITREDIIDYGRRKLTIAEDEDVKNIKKVAQAAAEKIFEQFVHARREKKEKIDKLKEEAKAQATPENPDPQPVINPNEIDCFFYMPDYPSTYEEATALNSFKYALNALIYVEERPVTIEKKFDANGNPIPISGNKIITEVEEIPAANKIPEDEIIKQKKLLDDLKKALKYSAKETAIRTFVVVNKEYNHKIIEPKPVEEGKPEAELSDENKGYNSINEIAKDVYQSLDKVASNLIKYQAFRANANLVKLRAVKSQPEAESRLEDGEEQLLGSEAVKEASKPIDKSKGQAKPDDKSKILDKSGVEQDKFVAESVPADQTLPRDWNFDSYRSAVEDLPEDKKSIAGLLSAWVVNIWDELEKDNKVLDEADLDQEDEYKYVFDELLGDLAASNGFVERNILSAGSESAFSKSMHKSMYSSAQRSRENWNQDVVLDMQDIWIYANDYILSNGDNIASIESSILNNLRTPGIDRTGMPSVPEKSRLRREAEIPELYPFSTIPIEELERALMLKCIEEQFQTKEPDFNWNLFDRSIEERYPKRALIQELSDALLWEPDTISKYFARDDSLLLAIYQKLPADKSYTKQWKAPYKSMPDFGNWLDYFSKDSESKIPLYDIDDNKVGQLREFIQNLTPSSGGLMRIRKYSIGFDEISQIEWFKDGTIFGICGAADPEDIGSYFWIGYDRNVRLDFRKIVGNARYNTAPAKTANKSPTDQEAPAADEEAERLRRLKLEEEAKQEVERQEQLHRAYADFKVDGAAATLAFNNGHIVRLLPNGFVMQSKSKIQKDLAVSPDTVDPDCEESRVVISNALIRYLTSGKIEILYANGNFTVYDPSTDLWTVTNNSGKRRCKRQSDGHEFDIEPIPAAIQTWSETSAKVLFKEDDVISILYPNGTRYTVHHDGTKIVTNEDHSEISFEKLGYSLVKVLSGRKLLEHDNIKNADKSDADIEFYDSLATTRKYLSNRLKDGQIIQTYLHDKSVVQSFVEISGFAADAKIMASDHQTDEASALANMQTDSTSMQAVHLIRRQDLSVTKVTSDGEVSFVSGPTRAELNKRGNLMKMGRDFDYLIELFETRQQEKKGGVFTWSLDRSSIVTYDKDRNYFAVNSDGTFEKILAPDLSEVDPAEEHQQEIIADDEIDNIDENPVHQDSHKSKVEIPRVNIDASKSRDPNQLPVAPRVFWIKVDGNGSEFFSKDRMISETGRFTHDVVIVKSTELLGQNPVLMHSYFKPLKSGDEIDEEFSVIAELQAKKLSDWKSMNDITIPKNVEEYQQVFRKLIDKPKSSIYLFKNYMQHKDFDHFKLSAFLEDVSRYKKWRDDSDAVMTKRFCVFEPKEDLKDRIIDKRIALKIYRERQTERLVTGYKQLKDLRINAVTSKFRKIRYGDESEPIKVVDKPAQINEAAKFNEEAAPAPSKVVAKQAPALRMEIQQPKIKRTQVIIQEIRELQDEPFFIANYFRTHHGKLFIKENPQKPPNEEVLMRMSQRMSRSIGATEGLQGSSHDADHLSAYSQNKNGDDRNKTAGMGSYRDDADAQAAIKDNPIVALEPEDDENRDQMRMSGMKQSQMKSKMKGTLEEPNYVPSMYLQEKDYLKRREEESLLKAEEYHVSKTKEFSVTGKLRPLKLKVKSLAKSTVKSEMNERFITTESITDKRIKISSMANRAYVNAPTVNQVRKQGQHQMILQAIAKKQTFNELISQANAMVTSVLNDPLKRSVNILPSQANFGSLKEGSKYELVVTCKNEDMLAQRVTIRQAKDKRIKILQDNGGPIAPGVNKVIRVVINATGEGSSVISDGFEILTKTDIYRIPITATILGEEKFNEINAESIKIHNQSAMKSTVREIHSRQKVSVNEMLTQIEAKGGWIETTGSESKLPSLPNIRNRAFEPDAQKDIDEIIEGSSRGASRKESNASRLSKRSKQSKMSIKE